VKPDPTTANETPRLFVIVTDIGGPVALHNLLSELPADFAIPILVLQTSDAILLESAIGALQRTSSLKLKQLEGRRDLTSRHAYFAMNGRPHRITRITPKLTLEPGDASPNWISQTLCDLATQLAENLTVAFLSGRGEDREITATCTALEQNRCRILVLNSSESMASALGRSVLANLRSASECSAQAIVSELLGLQNKSAMRPRSGAART
jgi:chemotaxis response regulator CheB